MSKAIVVGYDDKEPATRALERAIAEAKASHGPLVVVGIAEMPLNPEGPQNFGSLGGSPAQMLPLTEPPEIQAAFARAQERIEAEGLSADFVWAAGDPSSTILDVAREREAALVVLGSHHHSLLGQLLGADVAAEVKRQAGCDVIVAD
ncbi:MAG TPA: universal stress protein [Gaiellaceae bacterium]|jgi:nucleotide-binding universal stress UspA family protein